MTRVRRSGTYLLIVALCLLSAGVVYAGPGSPPVRQQATPGASTPCAQGFQDGHVDHATPCPDTPTAVSLVALDARSDPPSPLAPLAVAGGVLALAMIFGAYRLSRG